MKKRGVHGVCEMSEKTAITKLLNSPYTMTADGLKLRSLSNKVAILKSLHHCHKCTKRMYRICTCYLAGLLNWAKTSWGWRLIFPRSEGYSELWICTVKIIFTAWVENPHWLNSKIPLLLQLKGGKMEPEHLSIRDKFCWQLQECSQYLITLYKKITLSAAYQRKTLSTTVYKTVENILKYDQHITTSLNCIYSQITFIMTKYIWKHFCLTRKCI